MTSYRDWVVELSNTTGIGAYSLAGAPVGTSYFTFRQRFADGEDEVVYWVVNADRTKWEKNQLATLTYGAPDLLSRTVVESTNGDAPVSWVGGDLPLRIYVVPDSSAQQGAISGWLATARHALLRFGHWFKQDDPSSGLNSWKIFDGTNDIQVGIVDTAAHTLILDPTLAGWRQLGVATPVAAANVSFVSIPAAINHILLAVELKPGTNAISLGIQTYGADGVLDVGGSDYSSNLFGWTSSPTSGPSSTTGISIILNPASATINSGNVAYGAHIFSYNIQAPTYTKFNAFCEYLDSGGSFGVGALATGTRNEADRITGVKIIPSAGTLTGKVTLFGGV